MVAHGPYRQSERRDIYKKYVQQLLDNGKAYIAFDTPEELEAKRAEIQNFQYDAHTRMQMRNSLTLSKEEVDQLIADGKQYTVRFKIEPGQEIHVNDMIRGDVKVMSDILDDKVLYKSADELPTYHLANIVDDHLMEISHVIRGEEWLNQMPFLKSNLAPALEQREISKAFTNSSREKISCSVPGFQPRSARKLTTASGK